ncbi:hypothetical protein EDD17DRAFT_1505592 [Pisolithus thermaeus]|nr:hypothetical protein EDD17DRAFT_1505592 [Pisolithus thermaeus]
MSGLITFLPNIDPMMLKPIDVIRKGLAKLQDQIHACKVSLEAALKAGEMISCADEEWLDNAGNLVEEEQLVDKLEKALDYRSTLEGLDVREKSIVKKLTGTAKGDKKGGPAKKCNCMIFDIVLTEFRAEKLPCRSQAIWEPACVC